MLLAGALSHPCVSFYRFSLVLRGEECYPMTIFVFTLGDRNLCNFNK